MKFLNFDRVLCLSPHPDDVEYGMAGTILKFPATWFDLLSLTYGGDFDLSTKPSRRHEITNFWDESACSNVGLHFSPYSKLKEIDTAAWINYIETEFVKKFQYDAIFVPPSQDSHFEHVTVSPFGFALTRTSPISVIEYCSPSVLETWIPNLYVDVLDTLEKKSQCLRTFESQKDRTYFNREAIVYFHFHYPLVKRGLSRVERYRVLQHIVK